MEKENVPFKHEVKKTFTEFMTTTPIHGLPQLMNTKTWYMKIFWIIFIGALFGFGIWLVVKAITDYLEHPVVSEVQENIETQMEFPAVTFCNLDPFATQYAIDHVEAKLISVFNLSMNDLIQPTWATYSNLKKYQNFILNDISDPSYNVSTKQKFGVSLDKTLIDCHYNEESCLDTMANNFIWYYSYRYGNCFTFNSGYTFNTTQPDETSIKNEIPIKLVKKAGPLFGLNFEIFTGVDKSSFSMKTYGAILFIHKQTSKPESKPDSTGVILLKPGTYSDIAIKKSFTTQVPDPYSDCQDLSSFKFDRKYFNILNNEGIKYNQQDCLDLCMQQEIIDKCNCYFLEFFKLDNQTKACLSMDEVNCAYTNYEKFAEKDTVEVCKNQCPLECDSLEYDFTISSSGKFLRVKKIF